MKKYNEVFHKSNKLYKVLMKLGKKRNAITHFGIDETTYEEELIISILNVFDIIYNYLYPQLIELDNIGEYFTSDDLVVDTVHGKKLLFNKDSFIYNNIVDFLDELMETSEEVVYAMRASDPKSKICDFVRLMDMVILDEKFSQMIKRNNAYFDFATYEDNYNNLYFEVLKASKLWDVISFRYSTYFNVTALCGEGGEIYFLVVHDIHKLYSQYLYYHCVMQS